MQSNTFTLFIILSGLEYQDTLHKELVYPNFNQNQSFYAQIPI